MSTYRNICIFISVYNHRSITKAAGELFLSQPAVSMAIKEMESEYGTRLFERINRRLYPTKAGDLFYNQSLKIAEAFHVLNENMQAYNESSFFVVGSTPSTANTLLFPALKKLEMLYPDVKYKVIVDSGYVIHDFLMDNKVDFALIEGYQERENLCIKELPTDELKLVISDRHPLAAVDTPSLSEIAAYPLILRAYQSNTYSLITSVIEQRGLHMNVVCESFSVTSIICMVRENLGLSILPDSLLQPFAGNGSLVIKDIRDLDVNRPNSLIWREGKFFNQPVSSLIQMLETPQT